MLIQKYMLRICDRREHRTATSGKNEKFIEIPALVSCKVLYCNNEAIIYFVSVIIYKLKLTSQLIEVPNTDMKHNHTHKFNIFIQSYK